MRLSTDELAAIRSCASQHFGDDAVVRVFGSRVNDARRGGDIDLHVETGPGRVPSIAQELAFLQDLKGRIGDQRIDLIVRRFGHSSLNIDAIAQRDGIRVS